jgi:predicted RNA binding protein YcfA (HicA-like mRNA interferase family)
VESILFDLGFFLVREGKGAHRVYAHPDGRKTVIAFHPGDIPKGTLKKIISQAGLTVERFNELA